MNRLTLLAGVFAFTVARSASAANPEGPSGNVIVSRSSRQKAVVVWDATARVAELTARPIPEDAGLRLVTMDVVTLLGIESAKLRSASVTIRAVYSANRAAAAYGDPGTSAKVPLVEVTAAAAIARKQAAAWVAAIRAGKAAPHLAISALGRFPTDY